MTNRWQTFTNVRLDGKVLDEISVYCDEFLIHGVDVEGKASGVEEEAGTFTRRRRQDTYDLCRRHWKSERSGAF